MKSVLYVEDDEQVSKYMAVAAAESLDLYAADSVDAAQALLNCRGRFDVAILDERMPGEHGHALLDTLDKRSIPTVFYTAYADEEHTRGHIVYDKGQTTQTELVALIESGEIESTIRMAKIDRLCRTAKSNTERIEQTATWLEQRAYG